MIVTRECVKARKIGKMVATRIQTLMRQGELFGHRRRHRIRWRRVPKPLKLFFPGTSLRRRVVYSLGIVRLILAPVILLAIYYLFMMSRIVDRIVRVDAQVATLAENVSIQMLNARRMELNYFLLQDPGDLNASRASLASMDQTLAECARLQPEDRGAAAAIEAEVQGYGQHLDEAVAQTGNARTTSAQQLRDVVKAYENNLNDLMKQSRRESRSELLEDLRTESGSFDSQIAAAITAANPALRQATQQLQASSDRILYLSSNLETASWNRVRQDHLQARRLIDRAEWVLSIVSVAVIVLSLIMGYILPRQVVKPLMDLKAAVDHAAAGNYEIEFDVQGKGEVAQLAHSVRDLIAHVSEKVEESKVQRPG
jgi:nitrogen fixation/metabolism regulation signal transduction histidine kinase